MTHANNDRALLAYYATNCVNFLQTFLDDLSIPSLRGFLTLEDGTDRLSRNVSEKLALLVA